MDEANQELRVTIKKIWPLQAKKVLDLIIPQDVGKFPFVNFYTVLYLFFKMSIKCFTNGHNNLIIHKNIKQN